MSGALVKSVILAAIGLALQFILFLVKRGKARRLEEIKKKEEEEAKERMRLMEEEWKAQAEEETKKQPEFVLSASNNQQFVTITEVDGKQEEDLQDLFGDAHKTTKAYDGELTAMTFNHVKNSNVFQKRYGQFDLSVAEAEDPDFNEWL
jgi:hypothetical protein